MLWSWLLFLGIISSCSPSKDEQSQGAGVKSDPRYPRPSEESLGVPGFLSDTVSISGSAIGAVGSGNVIVEMQRPGVDVDLKLRTLATLENEIVTQLGNGIGEVVSIETVQQNSSEPIAQDVFAGILEYRIQVSSSDLTPDTIGIVIENVGQESELVTYVPNELITIGGGSAFSLQSETAYASFVHDVPNATILLVDSSLAEIDVNSLEVASLVETVALTPTFVVNAENENYSHATKGAAPFSWQQQRSTINSITVNLEPAVTIAGSDESEDEQRRRIYVVHRGLSLLNPIDSILAKEEYSLEFHPGKVVIRFADPEGMAEGFYEVGIRPITKQIIEERFVGSVYEGKQVKFGQGPDGDYAVVIKDQFWKLVADFDGSGTVNTADLDLWRFWFGQSIETAPTFLDMNSDGGISIPDFDPISSRFDNQVIFELDKNNL